METLGAALAAAKLVWSFLPRFLTIPPYGGTCEWRQPPPVSLSLSAA
jgi:hypothetical protein